MNEELAAYITHLCELSGHTAQIKKDLILVEPGEDLIYASSLPSTSQQ